MANHTSTAATMTLGNRPQGTSAQDQKALGPLRLVPAHLPCATSPQSHAGSSEIPRFRSSTADGRDESRLMLPRQSRSQLFWHVQVPSSKASDWLASHPRHQSTCIWPDEQWGSALPKHIMRSPDTHCEPASINMLPNELLIMILFRLKCKKDMEDMNGLRTILVLRRVSKRFNNLWTAPELWREADFRSLQVADATHLYHQRRQRYFVERMGSEAFGPLEKLLKTIGGWVKVAHFDPYELPVTGMVKHWFAYLTQCTSIRFLRNRWDKGSLQFSWSEPFLKCGYTDMASLPRPIHASDHFVKLQTARIDGNQTFHLLWIPDMLRKGLTQLELVDCQSFEEAMTPFKKFIRLEEPPADKTKVDAGKEVTWQCWRVIPLIPLIPKDESLNLLEVLETRPLTTGVSSPTHGPGIPGNPKGGVSGRGHFRASPTPRGSPLGSPSPL